MEAVPLTEALDALDATADVEVTPAWDLAPDVAAPAPDPAPVADADPLPVDAEATNAIPNPEAATPWTVAYETPVSEEGAAAEQDVSAEATPETAAADAAPVDGEA
jgi:hypothetical protein